MEGYYDHNINLKQIWISVGIGFSVGFIAGVTSCIPSNVVGCVVWLGLFGMEIGLYDFFTSDDDADVDVTTPKVSYGILSVDGFDFNKELRGVSI